MSPTDPNPILQIDQLRFAYPDQPPIAAGWSACIGAGISQLFGDTGSGKSTLLRLLAGTQPAAGGRLRLGAVWLDQDADTYARQRFFIDPADPAFDQQPARECFAVSSPAEAPALRDLVEGFALAPHLDKPLYMLSTGSRRKVWLASALTTPQPLILLDEPTGGLDAASIRCLWAALAQLARRGEQAVLLASAERLDGLPLAARIDLPLA